MKIQKIHSYQFCLTFEWTPHLDQQFFVPALGDHDFLQPCEWELYPGTDDGDGVPPKTKAMSTMASSCAASASKVATPNISYLFRVFKIKTVRERNGGTP